MIIGIDPASEGAVVAMVHKDIVFVASWKKRTRQKKQVYELTVSLLCNTVVLMCNNKIQLCKKISLHLLQIAEGHEVTIACEDAYVGRSAQTSIIVARFAGMMTGAISSTLDCEDVHWYKAVEWRKNVFGLSPYTKRSKSKEASIKYIPILLPTIKTHLSIHGELDHITDACGVALTCHNRKKIAG